MVPALTHKTLHAYFFYHLFIITYSFISFLGAEHIVRAAPGREPSSELTDAGSPEETGVWFWRQAAGEFKMGPGGAGESLPLC